ncbi:hypothetical protein KM043_000887 [Ampulex compressa]|nr:hypothetical protein KM043_000887 [Ampulex compressa]
MVAREDRERGERRGESGDKSLADGPRGRAHSRVYQSVENPGATAGESSRCDQQSPEKVVEEEEEEEEEEAAERRALRESFEPLDPLLSPVAGRGFAGKSQSQSEGFRGWVREGRRIAEVKGGYGGWN